MRGNTFHKNERLTSTKAFNVLFEQGKTITEFPFRLLYVIHNEPQKFPVKITFTVPKKNIAKAWRRNRIRRQMKEIYRTLKHQFYNQLPEAITLHIALIYLEKEPLPFDFMKNKVYTSLITLSKHVKKFAN